MLSEEGFGSKLQKAHCTASSMGALSFDARGASSHERRFCTSNASILAFDGRRPRSWRGGSRGHRAAPGLEARLVSCVQRGWCVARFLKRPFSRGSVDAGPVWTPWAGSPATRLPTTSPIGACHAHFEPVAQRNGCGSCCVTAPGRPRHALTPPRGSSLTELITTAYEIRYR
jgi:hypothetical protein